MDINTNIETTEKYTRNLSMEEILDFLIGKILPLDLLQTIFVNKFSLKPRKWFYTDSRTQILKTQSNQYLTNEILLEYLLSEYSGSTFFQENPKRKVCYLIKDDNSRKILNYNQLRRLLLPNLMIISDGILGFQQYLPNLFTNSSIIKCSFSLLVYPKYSLQIVDSSFSSKNTSKIAKIAQQFIDLLNHKKHEKLISGTLIFCAMQVSKFYLLDFSQFRSVQMETDFLSSQISFSQDQPKARKIIYSKTRISAALTYNNSSRKLLLKSNKRGYLNQQNKIKTRPESRNKTFDLKNKRQSSELGRNSTQIYPINSITSLISNSQNNDNFSNIQTHKENLQVKPVIKVEIKMTKNPIRTVKSATSKTLFIEDYFQKSRPGTSLGKSYTNTYVRKYSRHNYSKDNKTTINSQSDRKDLFGLYLQATTIKPNIRKSNNSSSSKLTANIRNEIRAQLMDSKNNSKILLF